MRKYIITLQPTTPAIVGDTVFTVEKTKFNSQSSGVEIFTMVEGKERKFIIPWNEIRIIEEVNE